MHIPGGSFIFNISTGQRPYSGRFVGLQPGETVKTLVAVRNLEEENKYVFFATRNGTVKKSEVREFTQASPTWLCTA